MSFSLFTDEPDDDAKVVFSGAAVKKLQRIIEQLASPVIGPGLRYSINEAQLTLWADIPKSSGTSLPVGQYQGQGYYMVSDNQAGFSDTFLIQGP